MDFFGYQEQARRNTAMLIFLFALAVVLIIIAAYAAVAGGVFIGQVFFMDQRSGFSGFSPDELWNRRAFFWIAGITVAIIAAGSAWRIHVLRQGGGAAVAEMLGGVRLARGSQDVLIRRLLNIVEEMAIASGLPVPPVYLLEENGINAFAAGFSPSDAVIGVTRGAVELLNRDQLQGVIAHEFSHILNGDSRIKMRLMGLLFGITLVSDAGIAMMTSRHSVRYSSRDRGGHPALLIAGLLLFAVGTIGAVMADFIKRAVSRQREFLADAAAVQFTRNPAGLAGALKIIGGYREGARIRHGKAREASHFFFGNALKSYRKRDWWATHPPLEERIHRIEPGFHGDFEKVDATARHSSIIAGAGVGFAGAGAAPVAETTVDTMMNHVGNPGQEHLQQARKLLARIPARLTDFAHDPYTARAAVYALLLDSDAKQRAVQLEVLKKGADANVLRETLEIQPQVSQLAPELRLPLLDMVLPALKTLSKAQYDAFRKNMTALIKSDHKISLFEYSLHRILLRHLHRTFISAAPEPVRYRSLTPLLEDCACLLAMLMRFGGHVDAEGVFSGVFAEMSGGYVPAMPDEKSCRLAQVDHALRRLAQAAPDVRRRLLRACIQCVLADGRVVVKEVEMLRAIAEALDAPMPPLLVA
ncbi:MAG: M48 family metallopeptidase [Mariprofundaceae bacterium]|nr:M48 family metallopeptidase [Mariprofundaceae bacterium]